MALEDIAGEVVDDDDLGVELGVDLHGSPKSHSVVTHCHFVWVCLSTLLDVFMADILP